MSDEQDPTTDLPWPSVAQSASTASNSAAPPLGAAQAAGSDMPPPGDAEASSSDVPPRGTDDADSSATGSAVPAPGADPGWPQWSGTPAPVWQPPSTPAPSPPLVTGFGGPPPIMPAPLESTPPAKSRKAWWWIALAAVGLVVIGVVSVVATGGDDDTAEPASTVATARAALDGVAFEGKNGWTMDISSEFREFSRDVPGFTPDKLWAVGPASDYQANVNVLFERTAVSLDTYMKLSVAGIKRLGPDATIDSESIVDVNGNDVGRIIYSASFSGQELKFFATVTRLDAGFAFATFVAPSERFDALLPKVEPYLLTLRPTE